MELDQWGETGEGSGQRAPSRRSHVLVNVFTIVRLPDDELYNAYRDAFSRNSCIQRGMTRRKALCSLFPTRAVLTFIRTIGRLSFAGWILC